MLPVPDSLSLREQLGQLIVPLLPSSAYASDTEALESQVAELRLGGWGGYITIFPKPDLTTALTRLQAEAAIPLLVACDLERGAGQHLDGLSRFPHLMALGASESTELAYQQGRLTALEARAAGVHWVLAPVADVNSNPQNPIINVRAFAGDAERVATLVESFVTGCQDHGALATVKHFPGHGDTDVDSHAALPVIRASREQLDRIDLPPFRRAIASGVRALMTAHIAVPALDPTLKPATLSEPIVTGLLRHELGYDGLVVTDAFNMAGVAEGYGEEDAAVQAIRAGCDVILMPPHPLRVLDALEAAVDSGTLSRERVLEACRRVIAAKASIGLDSIDKASPADLIRPHPDAVRVAEAIAAQAVTLVAGDEASLPLIPAETTCLVLDDDAEPTVYAPWDEALAEYGMTRRVLTPKSGPAEYGRVIAELKTCKTLLVPVFAHVRAWKGRIGLLPEMASLLNRLAASGVRVVMVSFSNPYLIRQVPGVAAYFCAYSDHPACQRAALEVVMGDRPPQGILPVDLGVTVEA